MKPLVPRRDAWLTSVVALLGASFTLWLFWPGYMTWDSADQWRQSLSGDFSDIAPPLMGLIWRWTGKLVPGPGGMLLLQTAAWWLCLGLAVHLTQRGHPLRSVVLLCLVAFWPAMWAIVPHIWKDVWMALAFSGASLVLLRDGARPSRWLRMTAVTLLAAGCAFRHNAILGALPLLGLVVVRELHSISHKPPLLTRFPRTSAVLLGVLLALFTVILADLPTRLSGAQRVRDQWAVVSIWDMASMSLREDEMLVPRALVNRPFTLDELRSEFTDYSNTTIFGTGMFRHPFFGKLGSDERRAAYLGWLKLVTSHPGSYLAHRLRLSALLFGFDSPALPDSMVLSPRLVALEGNPDLKPEHPRLQATIQRWLNARIDGPLFAGWIYALGCTTIMTLGWRHRRRHGQDRLAAAVAASGLLYALPLTILSGSAEFRYLLWMILSSALGALMLFSTREARAC